MAGVAGKPSGRRITDEDIARIREGMLELEAQIGGFRAALETHQSAIRRILLRAADAEEWRAGGAAA